MQLHKTRVLVTGAGRRIGRELAIAFGARGAWVAVHYRSSEAEARETLESVRLAGGDGILVQADLVRTEDRERMFAAIDPGGPLDVLVNNASIFSPDVPLETTEAQWDAQMAANARAPFFVSQHAARGMKAKGAGTIVNIADVSGELIWPSYFSYSVSKAALLAATRGLARALAPEIRVNAVCPGPVLFPENYTPEQKRRATDRTLLKRAGLAEDVVRAVLYLVDNGYVTGEVLHVDGGRHAMV